MVKLPWRKKPWDKVTCNFTVQEYDATGGRGWITITEPAGYPIPVEEARELFKPGRHYRVIARAVEEREGFKAGTYVGVVWKKYEQLPGGVTAVKEKPKAPQKAKVMDPAEMMDAYVEQVEHVVKPIAKLGEVMESLREGLFGSQPPPPAPGGGGDGYGDVDKLEYEGKAPWFMHPRVMHTIADEIKGVTDHFFTKFERTMGRGAPEVPEEEEGPVLPSLEEYAPEEVAEEVPTEEVVEEEEALVPPMEPVEEIEKLPEVPPTEAPVEEAEIPSEEEKLQEPLTPVEQPEEMPEVTVTTEPETVPPLIEEKEEVPEKEKRKRRKKDEQES